MPRDGERICVERCPRRQVFVISDRALRAEVEAEPAPANVRIRKIGLSAFSAAAERAGYRGFDIAERAQAEERASPAIGHAGARLRMRLQSEPIAEAVTKTARSDEMLIVSIGAEGIKAAGEARFHRVIEEALSEEALAREQ